MKPDYAFEFNDLAVLLTLELTEPADHADIEAITTSSTAAMGPPPGAEQGGHRPALRLVPDCLP